MRQVEKQMDRLSLLGKGSSVRSIYEYTSVAHGHVCAHNTVHGIYHNCCGLPWTTGREKSAFNYSVHPLAVVSLVLGPTPGLELWKRRRGTSDSGRDHETLKCTKYRRYWGGSTDFQLLLLWHW